MQALDEGTEDVGLRVELGDQIDVHGREHPAPPRRERIAEAIAALQAGGRTKYGLQRTTARQPSLAWTRRGAR